MVVTRRRIVANPEVVFQIIGDGWTYPSWVVGAVRMRAVDPGFPATGTRLHHSVGAWPLMISDHTEVTRCDPGKRLVLKARAWPAGEAIVDIQLEPDGDGTLVIMREDVTAGPSRLIPKPLRTVGLIPRNIESLRRLAFLAEQRSEPSDD